MRQAVFIGALAFLLTIAVLAPFTDWSDGLPW